MTKEALAREVSLKSSVLLVALELSQKSWVILFSDGERERMRRIAAGDTDALDAEIMKARNRFGLNESVPVFSCYEAGRDGFWLHRHLSNCGIENYVVDAGSIAVPRKGRRAKTDRIDARLLMQHLISYALVGRKKVWSVVRVPSTEAEDDRRTERELERLKKEETAHRARLRSLLALHGVEMSIVRRGFMKRVRQACIPGLETPLSEHLLAEIDREYARLEVVWNHQTVIRKAREEAMVATTEQDKDKSVASLSRRSKAMLQVSLLRTLVGIDQSAWPLVLEFFGWRSFANRRELAGAAGLGGSPHNSGNESNEQGISKAGNRRIRRIAIQLAWSWVRLQPTSTITLWFTNRFADAGKRQRRVGIVAVARRLLIALWHFVEDGVIPGGAELKAV